MKRLKSSVILDTRHDSSSSTHSMNAQRSLAYYNFSYLTRIHTSVVVSGRRYDALRGVHYNCTSSAADPLEYCVINSSGRQLVLIVFEVCLGNLKTGPHLQISATCLQSHRIRPSRPYSLTEKQGQPAATPNTRCTIHFLENSSRMPQTPLHRQVLAQ